MNLIIDGIGPVSVVRSGKVRRLSIRVGPSGVRLVLPEGVSLSRGREFLSTKREWIRRHIHRIDCISREHEETAKTAEPIIDVKSARNKIIKRIEELSAQHCLPYERVTIRSQRTRWGSCSARNNISLNIKLARLPGPLIDYVILHELVHTEIKGHGKNFWNRLEQLSGDALRLRKELMRYSPDVL